MTRDNTHNPDPKDIMMPLIIVLGAQTVMLRDKLAARMSRNAATL